MTVVGMGTEFGQPFPEVHFPEVRGRMVAGQGDFPEVDFREGVPKDQTNNIWVPSPADLA